MDTRTALAVGIAGGVLALAGIGGVAAVSGPGGETRDGTTVATSPTESVPSGAEREDEAEREDVAPPPAADASPEAYDTTAALLFLIEEEKLAHDVYATLADQWGTRVFSNIAASEVAHQELVAPLLSERGIEDPRSSEVGVFTDPALQALYDELIARGSQSLQDAIQVGVTIEETDIADLAESIASEDEADVVRVLERLLAGSENHLRSFERLA